MSQQELLTSVLDVLERLEILYLVTGSWASSLQGEPRSTHDLDLVVSLEIDKVPPLLAAFTSPDYYLSDVSVKEAVRHQSMFNLLDNRSGDKVDFWMLTNESWDQERFARREVIQLYDRQVCITTPEDTILAKLRWSKLSGGSEKQFTDALRVYEVQSPQLDVEYITAWASKLDVTDLWMRLQREADAGG
ncbi:MAG TPA: hypothetical protein P5307_05815 [Pirellulaceae bacterium]|nr:hypothetical protein [Planctomycetales bacterium]HRX78557.1 hypothetical protein [Pirellulaceae bacterium]